MISEELSDDDKAVIDKLLESNGVVPVFAAVIKWWDEFDDTTSADRLRVALEMSEVLENSLTKLHEG